MPTWWYTLKWRDLQRLACGSGIRPVPDWWGFVHRLLNRQMPSPHDCLAGKFCARFVLLAAWLQISFQRLERLRWHRGRRPNNKSNRNGKKMEIPIRNFGILENLLLITTIIFSGENSMAIPWFIQNKCIVHHIHDMQFLCLADS